jgi:HK97 family phage major capsid protein
MPKTISSTSENDDLIELVQEQHEKVVAAHKKTQEELDETKAELQEFRQKVLSRGRGGGGGGNDDEFKSIGTQLVESDGFKTFLASGGSAPARIQCKAVGTIGSGAGLAGPLIAPMTITDPVVLPQRRLRIRDLLAPGQTDGNTIFFPKMTVRYQNAAVVAEGAAKAQSGFDMVQATVPVRTIAHWVQCARNALDDAPGLKSLIDNELNYGLQFAEETEFLNGDGTGSHVLGIVPQATPYVGAFAITGEQALDRIALGILQAETALLPADGICLNPTDWMKARLLKDGMGKYILGPPNSNAQPMLWGLPVVPSFSIIAGNFLVGAFSTAAQIFDRMLVEILLSTEHNINFTTNEVTIRGEERVALAVKRPSAFIYGALP